MGVHPLQGGWVCTPRAPAVFPMYRRGCATLRPVPLCVYLFCLHRGRRFPSSPCCSLCCTVLTNVELTNVVVLPPPSGRIKRLRLVTDEAGVSAGVAFINFYDQEAMLAAEEIGQGLELDGCRPTVRNVYRDQLPAQEQGQTTGPPTSSGLGPQPGLPAPAAGRARGAQQQPPCGAYQRAQQQRQQQRQRHDAPDPWPWLLAGALPTAQHQGQSRGSRSSSASSMQSGSAGQLPRPPSLPGMAGVTGQTQPAVYPAAPWSGALPSEPVTPNEALYARSLACVGLGPGSGRPARLAALPGCDQPTSAHC